MLEVDAPYLNGAELYSKLFIIYKDLRALEMERKNNTLPSSKNGRVKCLWIKKNPYLCGVLLKAYKYGKREI